jgi:hypothetical protein
MEYQTFSEVTVEYSEVLKALFRPFKHYNRTFEKKSKHPHSQPVERLRY